MLLGIWEVNNNAREKELKIKQKFKTLFKKG